jgi:hypothetical protein
LQTHPARPLPHSVRITFDLYTSNTDKNYQAYLVRFKHREGQTGWRATLENVHTRETLTFATERELLVYLLRVLSESSESPDPSVDIEDIETKS